MEQCLVAFLYRYEYTSMKHVTLDLTQVAAESIMSSWYMFYWDFAESPRLETPHRIPLLVILYLSWTKGSLAFSRAVRTCHDFFFFLYGNATHYRLCFPCSFWYHTTWPVWTMNIAWESAGLVATGAHQLQIYYRTLLCVVLSYHTNKTGLGRFPVSSWKSLR